MTVTYFEEIKRYVEFGDDDSRALRAFLPLAAPHIHRISERFYEAIALHPDARAAITGGVAQTERLKRTLAAWMHSGLEGPHDQAYFERRCRIGRVHVQIALPQRYMFTAMDRIRLDFAEVADNALRDDRDTRIATQRALHKLYDLELAIMLETYREDSEDALRRTERLATIGKLAGNVAHDLRNPLGVIQSSLYLAEKRAGDNERLLRHIRRIGAQVEVCTKIINNLLELARSNRARRQPLDLAKVFDEALELAAVPSSFSVNIEIEPDLEAFGDPSLLSQALANLAGNAVGACDGSPGTIELVARRNGSGRVLIQVADNGPGFDPDVLARVFEPLVTTRPQGVGLGLSLVKAIVERHEGEVVAGNRDDGGAVVKIFLPSLEPVREG